MENILSAVKANIQKVLVGEERVTSLLLTALVAGGHVLIEDVPGMGKTVLARSLAKSVDGAFGRIQFTPDLLPSDVTGLNFFDNKSGEFQFSPGPVFCNILLADEINRATPRTQSALLECMAEGQVTVDGETRRLAPPFFVIATQNPVETLGTYPLPEAQLDRFLMRLSMDLPTREQERQSWSASKPASPWRSWGPCASPRRLWPCRRRPVSCTSPCAAGVHCGLGPGLPGSPGRGSGVSPGAPWRCCGPPKPRPWWRAGRSSPPRISKRWACR